MSKKVGKKKWASSKRLNVKNDKGDVAYRALIRLIYRRDHSEKELQQKLSRWYTPEAVSFAIAKAHEYKYLKSNDELAKIFGEALHQKGKGQRFINQKLKSKGLPEIAKDPERELSKCYDLLNRKFDSEKKLDSAERVKAYRYLTYRGFDSETIRLAVETYAKTRTL